CAQLTFWTKITKSSEIMQLGKPIQDDFEFTSWRSPMTRRTIAVLAMAAAAALASHFAVLAQVLAPAVPATATFTVGGDVPHPLSLTLADIKSMPRTTVTVAEEGREVRYEGVLVGEILKRAEAPIGRDLTGQAVASYVLAKAKDGYQVVFSLPELD